MVDQNQPEYFANPKDSCNLSITRTPQYLLLANLSSTACKTRATADVPLHREAGWIFEPDRLK